MENAKQITPFGTPQYKLKSIICALSQNFTGLEDRYFFTISAILKTIA